MSDEPVTKWQGGKAPGDGDDGVAGKPDIDKTDIETTRAYKSIGAWLRFLVPAVVGVALDLSLKSWAFPDGVPPNPRGQLVGRSPDEIMPVIPHILGFITTVNTGMVFGTAQGHVGLFLAFSLLALAIILWVFLSSFRKQWLVHIALGLITAGAIGNLYDRAVYHGVRDMLRFYVSWYPWIFNVADALLCVGVPLLILRWVFWKDPEPGKA